VRRRKGRKCRRKKGEEERYVRKEREGRKGGEGRKG
jgi:hypothetical protein